MRFREFSSQPIVPPQISEPLVLTARQQALAVAQAKKRKLRNLIAQRQTQERQIAATAISKQDIENAFVTAAQVNSKYHKK